MRTKLELVTQHMEQERYQEAIQLIQSLSQADLESSTLGRLKDSHLFDYAVRHGRLDIANAIIERYAEVTGDKRFKPLAIDYKDDDVNVQLFETNQAPFMSHSAFTFYKPMIDEQKTKFIAQIEEKSRELRIMGLEKLLKLTTDPEAHSALKQALSSYKENSLEITGLNSAIEGALRSLSPEDKQTTRYKKIEACLTTSNSLDSRCRDFTVEERHSHAPLESFKTDINNILKRPGNEILKHSSGPGEALASIGNILMRYSGVGFVVAAAQGKFQEYKQKTWDICNEKTASATKIDEIDVQASVKPGH